MLTLWIMRRQCVAEVHPLFSLGLWFWFDILFFPANTKWHRKMVIAIHGDCEWAFLRSALGLVNRTVCARVPFVFFLKLHLNILFTAGPEGTKTQSQGKVTPKTASSLIQFNIVCSWGTTALILAGFKLICALTFHSDSLMHVRGSRLIKQVTPLPFLIGNCDRPLTEESTGVTLVVCGGGKPGWTLPNNRSCFLLSANKIGLICNI